MHASHVPRAPLGLRVQRSQRQCCRRLLAIPLAWLFPAGLVSLRSLSLSSCGLSTLAPAACLATCTSLTSLDLSSNCLQDLASLPALPRLLRLDISSNQLTSLSGLALRCPLLCTLLASGNRLASFPPDLDLPFLRELWLSDCGMAEVPCWPWLPSLRTLRLQDNQLTALPPMHGFCDLAHLDLSFNALPALPELHTLSSASGGKQLFDSLTPLMALTSLKLNDNPLAGSAGYGSAVAHALPWLEELDLEPVDECQRRQRLQRACRSGQLPCTAILLRHAGPAGLRMLDYINAAPHQPAPSHHKELHLASIAGASSPCLATLSCSQPCHDES